MSWSRAEIAALVTKAARGGGAPAGQAERFGRVAALHLLLGRDALDLEAALDALPEGPILTLPLMVDQALYGPSDLPKMEQPQLLHSYLDALPFLSTIDEAGAGLRLCVDTAMPRPHPVPKRIIGCEALVARMTELAARTFVPESDGSRLSGAGAGLNDND